LVPKVNCWCGGLLADTHIHPDYLRCSECGTFVSLEQPSSDELREYYGFESYWHDAMRNVYNQPVIEQRAENDRYDRIEFWWNDVSTLTDKRWSMLEIGCAHGAFLNVARERGFKRVTGVEPDPKTCEYARQKFNLPNIYAGLWPITMSDRPYDVICGFDVLEHFSDPLTAMAYVRLCLPKGGLYMFQTPCYRGETNWDQFKPGEHLFLYDEKSIAKLMKKVGLTCNIKPAVFSHDMVVYGTLDA
jgi:2-polyprenyl-3-methyl-5-hydroxy-6-metoxy-1,4-benzoquinol methylase